MGQVLDVVEVAVGDKHSFKPGLFFKGEGRGEAPGVNSHAVVNQNRGEVVVPAFGLMGTQYLYAHNGMCLRICFAVRVRHEDYIMQTQVWAWQMSEVKDKRLHNRINKNNLQYVEPAPATALCLISVRQGRSRCIHLGHQERRRERRTLFFVFKPLTENDDAPMSATTSLTGDAGCGRV